MSDSKTMIVPIILAGGSGSRLWPLSRALYPKQFLNLTGDHSLLQNPVSRAAAVTAAAPVIICNETHRFLTAEQLRAAGNFASDNALVTFGITPTRPETGYGYIRADENNATRIASFEEKPDLATAENYVSSGKYYWNSGMFVFRADSYLTELKKFAPEIDRNCQQAYANAERDLDFIRVSADAFGRCESISIDHAVMEKTENAMVVPLNAGWSDVGSWDAVHALKSQDSDGNASDGDALLLDCRDCYINAESRLVAAAGLENVSVVETPDCVLVTHNDHAQSTKEITTLLKEAGRGEADTHLKVYRPWGSYSTINLGNRFQVKRITVLPGAKLSLQKHHHRAEHWIVVEGTAVVTCDDSEIMLTENQSTYIPLGAVHRLENRGKIPLELIEVQSGSYLGEDDIVRFDDEYGRGESY